MKLPRYFGIFFNENQNSILGNKNVRLALSYSTDKSQIIEKVLDGYGSAVNSPLIDGVLDTNSDVKKYDYDPENAKKILAADGWTLEDKGILKKKDQKLSIRISTSTWPELTEVASIINSLVRLDTD